MTTPPGPITRCALLAALFVAAGCAAGGGDGATGTVPPAPTRLPDSATTSSVATTTDPTTPPETPPVTTEPDTAATTTSVDNTPETTSADVDCRRITDFDDEVADVGWFVVNDGVMGGRSNGRVDITDSVMRFAGTVVTDGGGFTSVRYRLVGTEMTGTTHMTMRVRADQRVYGVTFEDDAEAGRRSVSHRADLDTNGAVDDDGWTITTLDYGDLRPSVFGRAVDAPPFNPDTAREIGIIIADGADGDFSLDIDWIDVCA